jgi:lysozyme
MFGNVQAGATQRNVYCRRAVAIADCQEGKMRGAICGIAVLLGLAAAVYIYYAGYRPDAASYPVQGIDVSHHQGDIDWSKVARNGVHFVYIKATEGADFRDKKFQDNWRAASAAGVKRGAYHFFTFCRPAEAQARNFIAAVPHEQGALAPALDLEFGGNCATRPSVSEAKARLATYSDAIFAAFEARPVLYVTDEFLRTYESALPQHAGLWIRSIAWRPLWSRYEWVYWQYHNRGHVDGIDGPVDLNVFNGTLADFDKAAAITP